MRDRRYFFRVHIITAIVLCLLGAGSIAGAIFAEDSKIKKALLFLAGFMILGGLWLAPMNIKITDTEIRIRFLLYSNNRAYVNGGFKTTVIKIADLEEIVCQINNNNKVSFLFKNGDAVLLDGGKFINKDLLNMFDDVNKQIAESSSKEGTE